MKSVVLSFLVLASQVHEYSAYDAVSKAVRDIYNIEDLVEHKELYSGWLFIDGQRQVLPAYDQMCYDAHMKCIEFIKPGHTVCAHHENYGLINFPRICELRLHNCLIKSFEVTTGNTSNTGHFYFNGILEDCQYYTKIMSNIDAAIEYYFIQDLDYRIKQYEEYMANLALYSD